MARIEINTITAQEVHDLARATFAMHDSEIGCTKLGQDFHLFDLRDEKAVEKLPVSLTNPERLLAHFKGFIANRSAQA